MATVLATSLAELTLAAGSTITVTTSNPANKVTHLAVKIFQVVPADPAPASRPLLLRSGR